MEEFDLISALENYPLEEDEKVTPDMTATPSADYPAGVTEGLPGESTPIAPTQPIDQAQQSIQQQKDSFSKEVMTSQDLADAPEQAPEVISDGSKVASEGVGKKYQKQIKYNDTPDVAVKGYIQSQRKMGEFTKQLMDLNVISEEDALKLTRSQARLVDMTNPEKEGSLNKQFVDSVNQTNSEIQQTIKELKEAQNKKVDPERYMREMSGFRKVLAVVDSFVTSLGKSRGVLPPNTESIADRIRKSVKEDIAMQINEINQGKQDALEKYNLLNRELANHSTQYNAKLAAEVKAFQAVKSRIETELEKKQLTDGEKLKGQIALSKLSAETFKNLIEMGTKGVVETVEAAPSKGNAAVAKRIEKLNDEVRTGTVKLPVLTEDGDVLRDEGGNVIYQGMVVPATSDTIQANIRKKTVGISELMNYLDEVDKIREEYGSLEGLGPQALSEAKARLSQLKTAEVMAGKDYYELGALAGPDVDVLEAVIADPTTIFSSKYQAKARQMRRNLAGSIRSMRNVNNLQEPVDYVENSLGSGTASLVLTPKVIQAYKFHKARIQNARLRYEKLKEKKVEDKYGVRSKTGPSGGMSSL